MSPYQHGEVFVTDDGAETDLDLGHYERFIDEDLNKYSNLTTGKVFWNVSTRSAVANTWERPSRSSRTSPTRSSALFTAWRTRRTRTSSSPRSAPPWATSRASPSSRPSARWRSTRARGTPFHPRDPRALPQELGRAQEQAHAALGQGTPGHGRAPGHHRAALRRAAGQKHQAQDLPLLQREGGLRHREPYPPGALPGARHARGERLFGHRVPGARHLCTRAGSLRLERG